LKYNLHIIYIMYWTDWSYGKRRMSSKLETLLEPPRKRNCFERFFCFYNKRHEENLSDSILYQKNPPKKVRFTFNI
jgi:hypothetical protein